MKAGDIVRVADVSRYANSFAAKVRDRDAIVERVFVPLGGVRQVVRVRFLKRNGRGREFVEFFGVEALRPA